MRKGMYVIMLTAITLVGLSTTLALASPPRHTITITVDNPAPEGSGNTWGCRNHRNYFVSLSARLTSGNTGFEQKVSVRAGGSAVLTAKHYARSAERHVLKIGVEGVQPQSGYGIPATWDNLMQVPSKIHIDGMCVVTMH